MDASAELARIAASLRAAGNGAAMRQVAQVIRREADPLVLYVKRAALQQLPHKGGLDRRVADEHVTVSVRTGISSAGVTLSMRNHDALTTDAGYVRHPVFGTWRAGMPTEEIPAARGWWHDTLYQHSREITPYIWQAMVRTAAEIQSGTLA